MKINDFEGITNKVSKISQRKQDQQAVNDWNLWNAYQITTLLQNQLFVGVL